MDLSLSFLLQELRIGGVVLAQSVEYVILVLRVASSRTPPTPCLGWRAYLKKKTKTKGAAKIK